MGLASGKHNSIPATPNLTEYNNYGDVNFGADRLVFIDGNVDVRLDVWYRSNDAPSRQSSDLRPEYLMAGGGHDWDSYDILDVSAEPQSTREAHL